MVGLPVTLNGESYTLIGVLPESFKFPVISDAEIWRTIQPGLGEGCRRGCLILRVLARLNSGISIDAARGELRALARRLEKEFPESNSKVGVSLVPLHEFLIGDIKKPMLIMFCAILLVLLIACVNVANLMLARSAARSRELAIRSSLGAGRWRIVRQLLIETMTLALIGGILGVLFPVWLVDLMLALSSDGLSVPREIRLDPSVLIFTAGITILSGVLAGLAPIFQLSRFDLNQAPRPSMFLPLAQMPTRRLNLTLRTATDPVSVVPALRRILASIDPNLAPANLSTMEEIASESISLQRFTLLLTGIFAVLAMILAAAGIYGVMSYAVTQRTREIGIRMALGAGNSNILSLVISRGMLVAAAGLIIGLAGAFGLTRVMSGILFEVSEVVSQTFALVSLIMLLAAFLACLIPAFRAVRVNPVIT